MDPLHEWRRQFTPLREVKTKPPEWVLPRLLPPGMTVLAGDPKTYKSRLLLSMMMAICYRMPFNKDKRTVPKQKGSAAYFAAEQSHGRIRHIIEKLILKRVLPPNDKSVAFLLAKEPWEWQVDQPDKGKDIIQFIKDVRPTVIGLDPWIHFHGLDENDPHMVKPLVPIRKEVLKYGGSLVIVHHANKAKANDKGKSSDATPWHRIRGTSALWGMADAGIMCSRVGSSAISMSFEFKDHAPYTQIWRPTTG